MCIDLKFKLIYNLRKTNLLSIWPEAKGYIGSVSLGLFFFISLKAYATLFHAITNCFVFRVIAVLGVF